MSDFVPVTGYYLENRAGTHNKFYLILVSETGVLVTAWGRIGTTGQSKVVSYPTHGEALDLGLRQLYSKKSKGYQAVHSEVLFSAPRGTLNKAVLADDSHQLNRRFFDACRENLFDGYRQAVAKHYDDFVKKAQALMDGASDRPFDEVYGEFEDLEKAWGEIAEHHESAQATIGLTRQMLQTRLLSGSL